MPGKTGKAEIAKALGDIKLLDAERRMQAAITLGLYGDEHVLPTLRQAAKESSVQVKVAALYSLCLLGDKEAIPQLIPHVANERNRLRKLALIALEQSTNKKFGGTADDLPSCRKAMESWNEWWKQQGPAVKWVPEKKRYAESQAS
jgi:hypothetical protein